MIDSIFVNFVFLVFNVIILIFPSNQQRSLYGGLQKTIEIHLIDKKFVFMCLILQSEKQINFDHE